MNCETAIRNKRQWIFLLCIILTGGISGQTLNFDMDDAIVYNSGEYISQSVTSGANTYTIEVRHATYTDRALLTDLGGGNQVFYFQAGGDTNPWVITFTKNGNPTDFTLNSIRYYAYNDDEISLVNQDDDIIAAATAYGSGTDGNVNITNTANATNISSFKILPETTVTLNNYGFDNINVSFPVTNTAPVIGGTTASQSVNDNSTISPFSTITTTDADGDNLSATITLDDNAKGLLTGTGLSGFGPYTIASTTPADLQIKLRALSYNPTENRTSTSETTTFTVVINDGADTDTDNTTTVISNAVAPVVTDVNVPSNATYTAGQNLDFTVNFNESINVVSTGIPQIAITIGSTIRHATYIAGSGTNSIIFRYTIQSGDIDTDGVEIGALTASGGTLRDSGGKDANLTLNNIGITTAVLVDAIPPPCSAATRLYVDSNAITGSNDGTSWTNAFTNLQDALNCIDDGEEIWVASGTYHPNSAPGTTLTNPTEFYFWMNKNIKLKGSYNPATNTQDFTNPSILSGDLGTTNTVHVLVTTNLNNTALVEGFTITKGAAIHHTGTITIGGQVIYYNRGGGIYNASSSPIFKNITISENKAQYGGGGMYNDSSSPAIVNLLSINNTVRGRYGGYSDSNAYGGGMYNSASSPTITNATFAYNTVRGGDGEMVVPGVGNDGGSGHGGGIYNGANSLATITNTVFIYNNAAGGGSDFGSAGAGYGAGIFNESSPSSLVNVTFNNNSAATNGGGMHCNDSNTTLYNTVFYGNGADISSLGGSTFMGASNFSENYTGTGFTQLTANPFLAPTLPKGKDGIWATPDDGLRLIATSPAIDAGNNANLPTDSFDLDGDGNTTESIPYDIAGEDRVQNTTVNIGAYEGVVSCPYPTATTLYVNASVSGGTNDGSSWANAYNNLQDAIWQTYICSNITEIWVAKGTYKPLNETTAIEIPEGISLYGGFAGTETALSDRDWTANQTILSGDLNSNSNTDDHDAHGILTVKSENIVIDGFIFEHGFADDGSSLEGRTGAALLTYTSAKDIAIKNCVFRNNEAGGTGFNGVGGAVITYGTNVSFTNCLFYANKAKYGGAVSIEGGSLKLINCSFTQNEATDNGGALNTNGKDVTIVNSLFTENTCGGTSCNTEINGAITNITYSYVKGKNPSGTGNIDGTTITDPLFVDAANNDFSLQNTSPLLNAGNNAANSEAKDLGNNARILGTTIDMGAYESDEILVDFTISGGYCVGNEVIFIDNSSSPNGAIVGWEWDFGDGNTSTEQNPTHVYTDTINAEIKLKVIDITGKENTITKTFSVQSPKAKFNANPTIGQAIAHTVFFTDQSTLPDTWEWDFGDGSTSTAQNPIHTYTAAGDYTVNLTVKDTMNGCVDKATDLIKIVIPRAQFSVTSRQGCGPLTVNFTDESTIDGNDTVGEWLWDFGDGNTSTVQNPIHTYAATGIYDVSLTITTVITGLTNTNTKSKFIQVIGANPDFSADVTTGCDPLTVRFSDATVFYGPPSDWLWDFGDGTTSNISNPTHTYTQNGEFDVSLTVTDSDGCSKTIIKKAYISTVETVLPTVITKNLTVPLDASGNVTITTTDIDNGSTDNCGIASMSLDKTSFDCSDVGVNTVTLTVTDTSGNSNTATATVTVEDNNLPTVITQDITIELDASGNASITPANVNNGSTDNCGIASMSLDKTSLDCSDVGINTVTLTVTDTNGNSNTGTAMVTVQDVIPPVPDLINLPALEKECAVTSADIPIPTATDHCEGSISATTTDPLDYYTQGTYTITWTYDDGNGNTSTQTQNIIIEDTTAPVANQAMLPDITAQCEVSSLIPPTVTDNCTSTVTVTNDATLPITTQGTTVVTWTYDDGNGNTSTQTQNIIIKDTTAPVADQATLPDITAECEVSSLSQPTATDNCTGPVSVTHNASLPITTQGTTVVMWTYEDASGNKTTQTQNVIIADTEAPELITQIDLQPTVYCYEVPEVAQLDFTDNCDNAVQIDYSETETIQGEGYRIVRTWKATDSQGNQREVKQDIHVLPTEIAVRDAKVCVTQTNFNLYSAITGDAGEGVWEANEPGIILNGDSFNPSDTPVGNYSFTYTEQKGMCTNQVLLNIEVVNDCIDDTANNPRITIANVLTPNGDGINDFFTIEGPDIYGKRLSLMVFNRWGQIVYESDNYRNTWNGSTRTSRVGTKGKVASGTYFYVIEISGNDINPIKGNIYIGTK